MPLSWSWPSTTSSASRSPRASCRPCSRAHGSEIPQRAGVLVVSKGLVPPLGTLPSAYAAERTQARTVAALAGPSHAADALEHGASVVLATPDDAFAHELAVVLASAGFDVQTTRDVTGVELAGCAKNAAALAAAAAAATAGPNVAGAAAGKVFGEIDGLARHFGAEPEHVRRARRRGRPRRDGRSRLAAATAVRASCSRAASRQARSRPRSATPSRRSTLSRCWPRCCARHGSRRPRRSASPSWSRGASSRRAGPRP